MKAVNENIFGIENVLTEPVNFQASHYISEHYDELLRFARKVCGNSQLAGDLLNDVCMNILRREENGDGYDSSKVETEGLFTVDRFVRRQIKIWGRNERYRINRGNKNEIAVGGPIGDDGETDGVSSEIKEAYYSAPSYDSLELVEIRATVEEELDYIIGFDGQCGVSIKGLLRLVADGIDCEFTQDMFANVRKLGQDVLDSLETVLRYGAMDHEGLCGLIESALVA